MGEAAKALTKAEALQLQDALSRNPLFWRMLNTAVRKSEEDILSVAAHGGVTIEERYRAEGAYQALLHLKSSLSSNTTR